MKDQRSTKNILVKPRQQLRYAAIVFAIASAVMVVFVTYLMTNVVNHLTSLTLQYNLPSDVLFALNKSITSSAIFIGLFGFFLSVGVFLFGITLSHRIFGPMIPIQKLVESLRAGDYSARGSLRRHDEFQDLMDDLNALAESLEKRQIKN